MAITKVSQYNSSPTTVADYQAQNNYLQALINQANGSVGILTQADVLTIPSISQGSYISMGGTLYIVDTEDYTILGSVVSGNNYIAVAVSGVNLTATWVQDISSYSWNSVYNYYSDGTNILLPYKVNFDTEYIVNPFNQFTNQNTKTTDDVEFNDINAGGNITTDGDITTGTGGDITTGTSGSIITGTNGVILTGFNGTITTGSNGNLILGTNAKIFPTTSPTDGTQSLVQDATWTLPRGVYTWTSNASVVLAVNGASGTSVRSGTIFSDGTVTLTNTGSVTVTITYKKF